MTARFSQRDILVKGERQTADRDRETCRKTESDRAKERDAVGEVVTQL